MRAAMKQLRNQQGFTLLELLVVVAILAIVAGGLVVAYEGFETSSAKSQASHTIAAVDNAIRVFTSVRQTSPDQMDSLIAVTPASATLPTPGISQGTGIAIHSLHDFTTDGDFDKFLDSTSTDNNGLTQQWLDGLNAAGIANVRYIDLAGNVRSDDAGSTCATTAVSLTITAQDGSAAEVGCLDDVDIPNRIFDFPREGSGRNRGRGFAHTLAVSDDVLMWNPGPGGINLTKVGANAGSMLGVGGNAMTSDADRLIALGLGNNATMYSRQENSIDDVSSSKAPNYPDVARDVYNRYIALYNVGSVDDPKDIAVLQAVIDSRGDFLDEELAEATGQKS